MEEIIETYTISLLSTNKPGVLVRVALVFAHRGFNIESLLVSRALDGRFARMTITASGPASVLEQIVKQVFKLVDIVSVDTYSDEKYLHKETALFKLKIPLSDRTPLLELMNHFEGKTIDFTEQDLIIQLVGESRDIDSFHLMLSKYKVLEVVRTGKMLIPRS